MKHMRFWTRATVTLTVFLVSTFALAAEYEAELRASVGTSDNIARTSLGSEVDETILSAGFDFAVTEETNRLFFDLRSNMDFLDYQDNTFDSEWIGGAYGTLEYSLIDERMLWVVEDAYGQQLFDPFEPPSPGNRENVNLFTTGPTFTFLAGRRNPIELDLRYSSLKYEDRPIDNDRLSGNLSIGRDLSRDTTLALNMAGQRIEFKDETVSEPIDTREIYVRLVKTGHRNTFSADIGYNEVESGVDDDDGLLLRLDWTRQTSPRGLLTVMAHTQFSDSGNIFRFYQEITEDLRATVDGPTTAAPFQSYLGVINYTLSHSRYSLVGTIDWNREDYSDDVNEDRDILRARMAFSRDLTRKTFASADMVYLRRDYPDFNRTDRDFILGINVGYRVSPGFSVGLMYQHYRRDGTGADQDYSENRAFLQFTYVPVWARRANAELLPTPPP